jgi:hypothetical protein
MGPLRLEHLLQCGAVQCSAVQCSAVQRSAVQFSAVQCSAVQCSAVQWGSGHLYPAAEDGSGYELVPQVTHGQAPQLVLHTRGLHKEPVL